MQNDLILSFHNSHVVSSLIAKGVNFPFEPVNDTTQGNCSRSYIKDDHVLETPNFLN